MQTIIRDGRVIKRSSITVRRGQIFNSLSSTPERWEYANYCKREHGHCDLCNTELVYKHKLQHQDTGQVLWIGCECVKWYYDAWQPTVFEKIKLMIEARQMETHRKYIAEKLNTFKGKYPELYSYFLGANKGYSYRFNTLKCDIVDWFSGMYITRKVPTSKFRASLNQKGYLNKFELESIYSAVMYGQFPIEAMTNIADNVKKAIKDIKEEK